MLHGGSSTGDENLNRCATSGIVKINIYSDFINGAYNAIKDSDASNYIEMKNTANTKMKEILNHYYDVFNTQAIEL